MTYIGRFAPSPTGPVHLGTLTAAVASFLHARQSGGEWLVRIEDVDPPREVPGSADSILRTLEAFDLEWDRDVVFQSRRFERYLSRAGDLIASGDAYYCRCSRRQIRAITGGTRYPGTCRNLKLPAGDAAIRLRVDGSVEFADRLQGRVVRDIGKTDGDFVIVRRDGLPAYHLAVVSDDADQGISDVVRGRDLLDCSPLHIALQRRLGLPVPNYWHIPIVTDATGEKLSKSAGAAAIDSEPAGQCAGRVLRLLGIDVPVELAGARPRDLWSFARDNWRVERLAARQSVLAEP